MAYTKLIRYRTRPENAERNVALAADLVADMNHVQPQDLGYAVLRLDQTNFLHIAAVRGAGAREALHALEGFRNWATDLSSRCVFGPDFTDVSVVGTYALPVMARGQGAAHNA